MPTDEAARAGQELFWLRVTAAAIDVVALAIIAQAAAVALYAASGGMLRSTTFARAAHCQPMSRLSPALMKGVAVPAGARPVAAQMCVISSLGLETGRYVLVALQSQNGEVVRSLAFTRPVDRKGAPVTPVILDWVWPLAFIAAMSLGEALTGATIGKRLVGLTVTDGSSRRPGLARTLGRNLVIWGGAALVLIAPLAAALMKLPVSQPLYWGAVVLFGLLVLAPIAMLIQQPARPLYDRWAGTAVVRR
ncbi:MAG: RDD family protein [Alphaproteobacteria bacterium]|nr:RDD family protein [Alphaproteobacteria bacterium]